MAEPELLFIPYEKEEWDRFNDVGHYNGGNQFLAYVTGAHPANWWTSEHPPEVLREQWQEHKRWYAVLHRFDVDGNHLGTDAISGGNSINQTESMDRAVEKLEEMMASLGSLTRCDIWVKLFGVEIDGYFFGLVYETSDDPDYFEEHVMLEPGDIMFHHPWDSGEYST